MILRKERIESEKIPFTLYLSDWFSEYGFWILWGVLMGTLLSLPSFIQLK